MATLSLAPATDLFYTIDDFTDPWRKPETILLCHGNNESHQAWYGWVPHLARHYRVVRPDMRGFGASTPMTRAFPVDAGYCHQRLPEVDGSPRY